MTASNSVLDRFRLDGDVAVVTGGANGIGLATAEALAAAGAMVVIADREMAAAEAAVAKIGGKAVAMALDVADETAVDRVFAGIAERYGRLDVLVNNAGGFVRRSLIVDAEDEYIDAVFRLNARSVVAVSRRVIPLMVQGGGGCIINVTTQAARTGGGPGAGLYAACKGFVSTLTRTMAKELVKNKIRVNAVAPGVIETPFHEGHTSPEVLSSFVNAIPMGRLGRAEECVGAFLFLADDAASGYVTGQILEVNGGQVMP